MRRPYHIVDRLNLLKPSASVIKLLSNPRIPINALAYGSDINRNSQVANQLNNLASGINYYIKRQNKLVLCVHLIIFNLLPDHFGCWDLIQKLERRQWKGKGTVYREVHQNFAMLFHTW